MASLITGVSTVSSTVCSGANHRKHQSSALLAFVRRIHWWPVNSPHKGPVKRKMFPLDDIIMIVSRGNNEHVSDFVGWIQQCFDEMPSTCWRDAGWRHRRTPLCPRHGLCVHLKKSRSEGHAGNLSRIKNTEWIHNISEKLGFVWHDCGLDSWNLTHSQRTHDVMITSSLRQHDVATSFCRYDDVIITSCVHWVGIPLPSAAIWQFVVTYYFDITMCPLIVRHYGTNSISQIILR